MPEILRGLQTLRILIGVNRVQGFTTLCCHSGSLTDGLRPDYRSETQTVPVIILYVTGSSARKSMAYGASGLAHSIPALLVGDIGFKQVDRVGCTQDGLVQVTVGHQTPVSHATCQ